MGEVSIIGLDLAKNVFQAHGAGADGSVVFRRKLSRAQLLKFMATQACRRSSTLRCESGARTSRIGARRVIFRLAMIARRRSTCSSRNARVRRGRSYAKFF